MSLSIDFYVRLFVRVHSSPAGAKQAMSRISMIHQCVECDTHIFQPIGSFLALFRSFKQEITNYYYLGTVTRATEPIVLKPATCVTDRCPECSGRLVVIP